MAATTSHAVTGATLLTSLLVPEGFGRVHDPVVNDVTVFVSILSMCGLHTVEEWDTGGAVSVAHALHIPLTANAMLNQAVASAGSLPDVFAGCSIVWMYGFTYSAAEWF